MTSSVNVGSQLIHSGIYIFIFISLCIQCDASNNPGMVLDYEENSLKLS